MDFLFSSDGYTGTLCVCMYVCKRTYGNPSCQCLYGSSSHKFSEFFVLSNLVWALKISDWLIQHLSLNFAVVCNGAGRDLELLPEYFKKSKRKHETEYWNMCICKVSFGSMKSIEQEDCATVLGIRKCHFVSVMLKVPCACLSNTP